MKIHKNIFILILLIGNSIWSEVMGFDGYVQTGDYAYFFTPQNLGTSTPQVADMIRYGNIPVNKYHGLLDFGIALEGFKDKDFDIPIALKYFSGGFMPCKRPSFVGYNWTLHCGGVITRKLNGSPDDVKGKYRKKESDRDYLLDGLLVAVRDGRYCSNNNCNYSESQLIEFNVGLNKKGKSTPYLGSDFKHEFESDIYTFAFGCYYGSFIIGNDGLPVLLGDNGCKINISGMTIQSYSTTETPVSSSIEITTPDGYIYTFGGASNYLEYFIPNNPSKCKIMPRYITSWYLKSIKSPNDRTVNFSYHSKMQMNKYRYLAYAKSQTGDMYGLSDEEEEKHNIEIKDKVYTPVLDKISVDNVSILFSYNENVDAFYSGESEDKSIQLQRINRYVDSILMDRTVFSYQTKDRYFFLKSVSQKGLKHEFKYNLSQTLPDPMTVSFDHWGFWAGGYATTISNVKSYCLDMYNQRVTNPNVCDVGLLNEIIYPTGGKTVITYEPNQYITYFTRYFYGYYKYLMKFNKTSPLSCGGARVQSVKDYSILNDLPVNVRTFLYQDSNNECGVIGIEPKYKMTETMVFTSHGIISQITNISGNSFGSNNLFSEYYIGYPSVTEIFKDNGYAKYKFTSRLDVSDSYDVGVKTTYAKNPNFGDVATAEKYGTLFTNDKSLFRGRLLEETIYDDSGNKVLQTVNKYNIEDAENKYNISLRSSPRSFGYYKIYLTPCLLIQQNITNADNIQNQINYTYNTFSSVKSKGMMNSDGKRQTTKYVYPFETTEGQDMIVMQKMTEKNILSNYVEKITYLDNGNVIGGEYRKYNEVHPNLFMPERIDLLREDNITLCDLHPLSNSYVPICRLNSTLFSIIAKGQFMGQCPEKIQIRAIGKGSVEIINHNRETIYSKSFNSGYQEEIDINLGNYLVTLSSTLATSTSITIFSKRKTTMVGNTSLQPEMYHKYDTKGNTIESTLAGSNISTTYLWGYNYQYPIAKIENATYDQMKNILDESLINRVAAASVPADADLNVINNLRNNTDLSNILITTYTYKPLVGMLSAKDPGGKTVYYEYDDFGRLKCTKDHIGRIIENYDYHYRNQ